LRPAIIFVFAISLAVVGLNGCGGSTPARTAPRDVIAAPTAEVKIPISDGFDFPVGKTGTVTEAKDRDAWYNAQDFTVNSHLGEDWNLNTGGNIDCREPVYAAAKGLIVYAQDAGEGWGNVLILEHRLSDGAKIQTLYGHLRELARTSGEMKRRELGGKVGDANGRYPCHLHFEVRLSNCPSWSVPGPGYSDDAAGWTDPSKFINSHRPPRPPAHR
jgi:murein DD-endopeptidase MepM/ murein hydrolase activator NlpD